MTDPTEPRNDDAAPASAPKERRSPRTLAEKLEDLAASARGRIDKLQARELRLVTDLGKVRTELHQARAELAKITGSAERVAPANTNATPERQEAMREPHAANGQSAPF